jgi:hypothetical protein
MKGASIMARKMKGAKLLARKFAILTFVLHIAGFTIFGVMFMMRTDEEKILRRFAATEEILQKEQDDGPIIVSRKMQQFLGLLADTCRFHTAVMGYAVELKPKDLAQALGSVHLQYSSLAVEFHDIEIEFEEERKATAHLTIHVLSRTAEDKDAVEADYAVECKLVKPKRKWLLNGGSLAPKRRE